MKPATLVAVVLSVVVVGVAYRYSHEPHQPTVLRDAPKSDELQDINLSSIKEQTRGTRLVEGRGADPRVGSAGRVLTCRMKDLAAKPWVEFVVTFKGKGQASMEYFKYPFYGAELGAELLPVGQPLDAEADEDMTRLTKKQIYVSWGGDGDAAYVSVRKNSKGVYSGNFYFPNGGVADFGDEAEVPVTCTLK